MKAGIGDPENTSISRWHGKYLSAVINNPARVREFFGRNDFYEVRSKDQLEFLVRRKCE
jgi:hypothetical protein